MQRLFAFWIVFVFPFLLFFTLNAHSKTILVPDEAASVQEAVEMAVSGDEIILSASHVDWTRAGLTEYGSKTSEPNGIRFQDMSLVIRGAGENTPVTLDSHYPASFDDRNTMLWMENADVTFRRIAIDRSLTTRFSGGGASGGPLASPWHIESGTLTLEHCHMVCWFECKGNLYVSDSTIHGFSYLYGYAYNKHSVFNPTLQIGPANGIRIRIANSVISGDFRESYRNLVFESLYNSTIQIADSEIKGGTYRFDYGSYPGKIPGSDAFEFHDCNKNELRLANVDAHGGNGNSSGFFRHGILSGGSDGGDGIALYDSSLTLSIQGKTSIRGGTGGYGLAFSFYDDPSWPIETSEAGDGGSGIRLIRSTLFMSDDSRAIDEVSSGNQGGSGSTFKDVTVDGGAPGKAISMDAYSFLLRTSLVDNWSLYP